MSFEFELLRSDLMLHISIIILWFGDLMFMSFDSSQLVDGFQLVDGSS